jgi:hypothetical protein
MSARGGGATSSISARPPRLTRSVRATFAVTDHEDRARLIDGDRIAEVRGAERVAVELRPSRRRRSWSRIQLREDAIEVRDRGGRELAEPVARRVGLSRKVA